MKKREMIYSYIARNPIRSFSLHTSPNWQQIMYLSFQPPLNFVTIPLIKLIYLRISEFCAHGIWYLFSLNLNLRLNSTTPLLMCQHYLSIKKNQIPIVKDIRAFPNTQYPLLTLTLRHYYCKTQSNVKTCRWIGPEPPSPEM